MNMAFILMMIAYTLTDSLPISICIKVEDREVDTVEINSVDEIRFQAFCKFKNEENWEPASVRWNISNELENCISTPASVHASTYTLSLKSIEVDYGNIWISLEGTSISDTVFVNVVKCTLVEQFNSNSSKMKCGALKQYDLLGKYHSNTNSNIQMLLLNNKNKSINIR